MAVLMLGTDPSDDRSIVEQTEGRDGLASFLKDWNQRLMSRWPLFPQSRCGSILIGLAYGL
jgi:hypothetical protein